MLWAIDVGNTNTVVGLYDGGWTETWRLGTHNYATEDELAATLTSLCSLADKALNADGAIVASVVPALDRILIEFCRRWLDCEPKFLRTGDQVSLEVQYSPPHAVGADRLANALGALAKFEPPLIVVDFGTATTFDTVDGKGRYVGGAIMPGPEVSASSLASRTAKLPSIALEPPTSAVGKTIVGSLQSGLVLGYADAIDGLLRRIKTEIGENARVVSTGGLGQMFADICQGIELHDPQLTLDGLRIAWERMRS